MKEFEKWFKEKTKDCRINDNICNKVGNCDACKLVQEIGWRAALEMVKNEIFEHKEALDVIEEELNE